MPTSITPGAYEIMSPEEKEQRLRDNAQKSLREMRLKTWMLRPVDKSTTKMREDA